MPNEEACKSVCAIETFLILEQLLSVIDYVETILFSWPLSACIVSHAPEVMRWIADQFFFVLAGIATIDVEGEIFTVPASSGIHVSAGVKHQIKNNQKDWGFW